MSSLFLLDVYALETQTFVCGNQIWHFSAKKLGNSSEEFTFCFFTFERPSFAVPYKVCQSSANFKNKIFPSIFLSSFYFIYRSQQ